jgi:hypothetical protein
MNEFDSVGFENSNWHLTMPIVASALGSMPRDFPSLLIASMAGWIGRQSASQIDYLKGENRALRSSLGRGRIVFTDAARSAHLLRKSELKHCED